MAGQSQVYYLEQNDGFCNSQRNQVIIVAAKTPTKPSIKILGNDTICKGSAIKLVAIHDTSMIAGSYYKSVWYTNNGSTILGTKDTISITPSSATTFYLSTIDSVPPGAIGNGSPKVKCESPKQSISIVIDSAQTPSLTLPPYYCYGTNVSVTINNLLPLNTVTWYDSKNIITSTNSTLYVNSVFKNDTFSVQQTSALGCLSAKKKFILPVQKDSLKLPQVLLDNGYCVGSNIVLQSTYPLSAVFNWYNKNNTIIYTGNPYQINNIQNNDTVLVESISINGCVSPKRELIIKSTSPTGMFTATKLNLIPGDATHFINTSNGGLSYYWDFGDGTYSTATSPWHYFNSPGNYSIRLIVTDQNGCTDTLMKSSYIKVGAFVGISELYESTGIMIYPSPFKESLTIENKNNIESLELSLINILGQKIFNEKLHSSLTINTSEFSNGTYFIEIKSDDLIRRIKLIKAE